MGGYDDVAYYEREAAMEAFLEESLKEIYERQYPECRRQADAAAS